MKFKKPTMASLLGLSIFSMSAVASGCIVIDDADYCNDKTADKLLTAEEIIAELESMEDYNAESFDIIMHAILELLGKVAIEQANVQYNAQFAANGNKINNVFKQSERAFQKAMNKLIKKIVMIAGSLAAPNVQEEYNKPPKERVHVTSNVTTISAHLKHINLQQLLTKFNQLLTYDQEALSMTFTFLEQTKRNNIPVNEKTFSGGIAEDLINQLGLKFLLSLA
ncbi:hypothetical protein [Pleionea sp. CnH1-48]|uniref:hypothetical protein n=1 Tax=Pleionea sp. CnH1-48 TaxID=2954494 RepID=UPI002096E888|nr:hypothetical protein [Pleionea sp. CnH1-48]MCO7225991.1 hypothetical protein [Pleionea sp. CnH1-48]